VGSEEARSGTRVKDDYRKPELRGAVGKIVQSYGHPNYLALDVRLDDGRPELFWHHELEETEQRREETGSGPILRLRR
jgi:hypothetical protein